jgi:HPt (histidine-containing phosphotransfer) domain-containing protein
MTAAAMRKDQEACLEAGMDDYLSKPVEVEDLVAQLKRTDRRDVSAKDMPGRDAHGNGTERSSTERSSTERSSTERSSTEPSGINEAAFDAFRAGMGEDTDFVRELIDDYIDSARHAIDLMHEFAHASSTANGEAVPTEELERAAHSLKSSSQTVGALAVGATAEQMETLAHDGVVEEALALVPRLAAQFEQARRDLTHLLGDSSA